MRGPSLVAVMDLAKCGNVPHFATHRTDCDDEYCYSERRLG
jgi:hypothetical protein